MGRWAGAVRDRAVLLGAARSAAPGLTLVAALVAVVSAALHPAFNVVAGVVAGRVEQAVREAGAGDGTGGGSVATVAPAFALAAAIYLATHVAGPVRESLLASLHRRVDARVTVDVMRALARPRGVPHLEDPAVLDLLTQAQGSVTLATPGAGVYHGFQVLASRLQGALSLGLLAGFSPLLALGLAIAHAVAYRWRRWHWSQVTSVVMSRTEGLRRSHYLWRLAVEPDAAKEARVFALAGWLRGRYRHELLAVLDEVWRRRRTGGLVALAVTAVLLVIEGEAIALVAVAALDGRIDLAAAMVYVQVTLGASNLSQFGEGHFVVADGADALRRLRSLQAAVATEAEAGADDTAEPVAGRTTAGEPAEGLPRRSIRFEGVRFTYPGAARPVYDGLDLTVEAGRSLAIVGENGAGKTTLVKLLSRLYEPTGGRITVDGVDLRHIDTAAWQRRVAAIFQDFVRYKLTAADNVAFGARHVERTRERLDRAADAAGAAGVVARLADGWDTVLSRQFDGGTDLSGGEWQRLALARAVYAVQAGAGVLVLDEPTAALDVRGEAEVYDRFLELTRGLTTVVVSHRFSTVRRADRIVVVEEGRVVEDGTHDELVAAGGRYAVMYELQAARFRDEEPTVA
jgi:ATP-binding cassette subfamily B protein